MNLLFKYFQKATIVTLLLLTISSSSFARRKYVFDKDFAYKKDKVEVRVDEINILPGWGGMIIDISVQNNGTKVFNFSVDDFEVLNTTNNQAHYSFSKGKNVATVPYVVGTNLQSMNILIGNTEVNPNRSISGTILILAGEEQLKSLKNFDLIYTGQTLNVTSKK